MQFSPWQFNASLPQGLTWATPQPQALLTQNHPIFIRGELSIHDNCLVKIIVRKLGLEPYFFLIINCFCNTDLIKCIML